MILRRFLFLFDGRKCWRQNILRFPKWNFIAALKHSEIKTFWERYSKKLAAAFLNRILGLRNSLAFVIGTQNWFGGRILAH